MSPSLCGQQASGQAASDPVTLEILLKRIDQLEARVQQLEAERQQGGNVGIAPLPDRTALPHSGPPDLVRPTEPAVATAESSKPALPVAPPIAPPVAHTPAEQEPMQGESAMAERMDMSKTLLRIRGFGDVDLHGDTQKGDTTSFSLGELDLFVTSDISDKFKFLSEIVFEGGPDNYLGVIQSQRNSFSVDLERYLVRYSQNDYLNISAGRGHTAIGYYNTAYHHSTWLQTTTDRPFLFAFEDSGGILPIHTVGATVSGLIPSGSLGLHYIAEIGNGRESRYPLVDEPVQNEVSDANHKAVNLAMFARPDAVRGLQTGFSVYRDLLVPANQSAIHETILAAHAVLIRPRYEWLNEVLLDRHALVSGPEVFNTVGFYTQTSRQFGSFRPYVRYQYVNVPRKEPVYPDVGLRQGPSLGIRYDASESVALKFQYDYTMLRDQPAVKGLTLQLGFTF
ncbi:hypothetical protein [Acidicapsa acidisoli]|uniref:hypothetical protein n=1 Tax=Acidicapsa acidisoli TaxID=1615681 RepID=UPI0021DFE0B2|nr:hypothetical protein [Acidicapsa acidisoli]